VGTREALPPPHAAAPPAEGVAKTLCVPHIAEGVVSPVALPLCCDAVGAALPVWAAPGEAVAGSMVALGAALRVPASAVALGTLVGEGGGEPVSAHPPPGGLPDAATEAVWSAGEDVEAAEALGVRDGLLVGGADFEGSPRVPVGVGDEDPAPLPTPTPAGVVLCCAEAVAAWGVAVGGVPEGVGMPLGVAAGEALPPPPHMPPSHPPPKVLLLALLLFASPPLDGMACMR